MHLHWVSTTVEVEEALLQVVEEQVVVLQE